MQKCKVTYHCEKIATSDMLLFILHLKPQRLILSYLVNQCNITVRSSWEKSLWTEHVCSEGPELIRTGSTHSGSSQVPHQKVERWVFWSFIWENVSTEVNLTTYNNMQLCRYTWEMSPAAVVHQVQTRRTAPGVSIRWRIVGIMLRRLKSFRKRRLKGLNNGQNRADTKDIFYSVRWKHGYSPGTIVYVCVCVCFSERQDDWNKRGKTSIERVEILKK